MTMRLNKCDSNIKKKIVDIDANSKYHQLYIIYIILYIIIYYIIYKIKHLATVV